MRRIAHQRERSFALALAGFVLLLFVATEAWANTQLAVIGSDADSDLIALLTARFSQSPGVDLVEREEMQHIAAEHQLQELVSWGDFKQAGAFLKAEGLIVLTRETQFKRPVEMARLIAVEPGVVVDAMAFPVSDKAESDAALIHARLGPLIEKVRFPSGQNAVAISLLGLKFDVDALQAKVVENQLNRLVADRLIHEAGFFVLERWRMESLAWEKSLSAAPAPFWTGSYLLEGSIHRQGKMLTLSVSLKKADSSKMTFQFSGSDDDLDGIADGVATKLKAELGTPGTVSLPWDKIAEAENFARLAEWAMANKLSDEAVSAADSAVALGLATPRVKALQIRAYAMLAYPDDLSVRNSEPFFSKFKEADLPLNLEALTEAVMLLTRFQQQQVEVPRPESFTLEHPEYLTPRLVTTAFRVLRRVHQTRAYLERPSEAAALRAAVRQAAGFYASANVLPGGLALTQDNVAFAPYWTETPEETLAVYKAALEAPIASRGKRSEMELMRAIWGVVKVRYPCFDDPVLPNTTMPCLVAWNPGEEQGLRELWRNFVDELKRSPSIQAQLDGLMLEYHSTKAKKTLMKPMAEIFWNRRVEIFGSESQATTAGVLSIIRDCSSSSQTPSFSPDMLGYMLDRYTPSNRQVLGCFLDYSRKWTEAEAKALEPKLTALEQAFPLKPNEEEKYLRVELACVHNSIWRQYPALAPQAVSRPGEIAVGHFWNTQTQPTLSAVPKDSDIAWQGWRDGKLWFTTGHRGRDHLCGIDPLSLDLVDFENPAEMRPVDITSKHILYTSGSSVLQVDRVSGESKRWSLPVDSCRVRALASGLYATFPALGSSSPSKGGGLLKLNTAVDSCDVLISSRRTPLVSTLDGRSKNTPQGMFEDSEGNVYFWWWNILDRTASPGLRSESQVYRWSGERKEWEKVFSSVRGIRLKDERPGALIMTRGNPPDGLSMYGYAQFEQIVLLNPETGKFELLLENPDAEQHPLNQPARWDFPPELCRIFPNAVRFHEMAWYNGTLWVLAYDKKLGENNGSEYLLFAFVPSRKTAVQIPLRFTLLEEDQKWSKQRAANLDKPILADNGLFATPKGLVITAHMSPGFWFLLYSEIPQLSQPAVSR